MTGWVNEGYRSYSRRMPENCALELIEIPVARRAANAGISALKEAEGRKMLAAAGKDAHLVALDAGGQAWESRFLAHQLNEWRLAGRNVCLFTGGPDGLWDGVTGKCAQRWSLSALTFPHAIVRIIVAEQIYRAWSILHNHPYHR